MAFAKGHAKFQANRWRCSRVIALTDPILMQYAICRYFGHKIISISLNFWDIKISITALDSPRKTALEKTNKNRKLNKFFFYAFSRWPLRPCFFSDWASKLIRLKNGFYQGPCKISSQSVKAFSNSRVNARNSVLADKAATLDPRCLPKLFWTKLLVPIALWKFHLNRLKDTRARGLYFSAEEKKINK